MLAVALLVLGAALVTVGVAVIYWPAGLIVGGLGVGLLGWDLGR